MKFDNNDKLDINLLAGFKTAFLDGNIIDSDAILRPQFLSNEPSHGKKVLTAIEDELQKCSRFSISVAFVTSGGIVPLLQTLSELEERNVKGQILTTDYLQFSEPKALRKLAELKNIEVKLFCCDDHEGFHTKGYIFEQKDLCRIIVGSSNLTQTALTTNREWNARLISKSTGEFAQQMTLEFEQLWHSPQSLALHEVIDEYEAQYHARLQAQKDAFKTQPRYKTALLPQPNAMQRAFVENIKSIFKSQETRALLISATGTGKTYAAAFASKELNPKRVLFLVHREQINEQAKESFQRVIGNEKSYGFYSGSRHDENTDYLFATMQTMSRPNYYERFDRNAFDLIIIDEVHRAGAKSYESIMNYFQPKFWLGMTASPDRPDGVDIYSMFHHNIAYEIRLQTALEEDLLCPFHYFGVTDVSVNGQLIDGKIPFKVLEADERVDQILDRASYFGYSGDRVKGLIFCSLTEECEALSKKFNDRGLRTIALSGKNSIEQRELAIRRLTQGIGENRLDYIFTVDIFNEGVDIPEINQVILLRPTESPIIFIQQLGRGLRKAENKQFVVVIDFIGNYSNDYLIPVALSGDRSYNKDNLRRYVSVQSNSIPGASTVHFDPIARKRILQSIDSANTEDIKLMRQSYKILKFKLGRLPKLTEFEAHDGIDPIKFFNNNSLGSYYTFLKKYETEYTDRLSDTAESMLNFVCRKLGAAQRITETIVLSLLLESDRAVLLKNKLIAHLENEYGLHVTQAHINNVISILSRTFERTEAEKNAAKPYALVQATDNGDFTASQQWLDMMKVDAKVMKDHLNDLINFMKKRYKQRYKNRYKDTDLVLYEKYTYEDVCRLLNWSRNITAQNIGGYFYDKESRTMPVFVNYEKTNEAIAYEDRFISEDMLIALSKTKRAIDSPDADRIFKRKPEDQNNRLYLFVRRNKNDKQAKAFYFLGEIKAKGQPKPVEIIKEGKKPEKAFEIDYQLENSVRRDIYEYLTGA